MTKRQLLCNQINAGVQAAVTRAIERHRRLGKSIVIWCDGKVVILTADQIPQIQTEHEN